MEKASGVAYASPPVELSNQPRARLKHNASLANAHFAGRVGGNQEFIVDPNSEDTQLLLKKQPDAAPLATLSASLDLKAFFTSDLWRMAVIEGWGTFLLICLLGAMASGLTTTDQSLFAQALYGAVVGSLALAFFTFGLAPVSGAHLNPTITMATFFAGLSTLPRTVLYIVAQSIGAIAAGGWLRLGLGDAYFPVGVIPGCTVDPQTVSPGQLFALEYMICQALIVIAFGIGLDPRQGRTVGPAFAPVLIGLTLGLGNLCSALAKPGYTGMSFNPARCLGLMVAKQEMQYHYVHWLAPLAAAILNGCFYHLAPPWARETPLFARFRHGHRQQHGAHSSQA